MISDTIRDFEKYSANKHVDFSGLRNILPRGIMPSDIDCCIDNDGKILLIEFKGDSPNWFNMRVGQRRMYESLVSAGNGNITAVCCHHKQPDEGRYIDAAKDVIAYQVMSLTPDNFLITSEIHDGSSWIGFLQDFKNKR